MRNTTNAVLFGNISARIWRNWIRIKSSIFWNMTPYRPLKEKHEFYKIQYHYRVIFEKYFLLLFCLGPVVRIPLRPRYLIYKILFEFIASTYDSNLIKIVQAVLEKICISFPVCYMAYRHVPTTRVCIRGGDRYKLLKFNKNHCRRFP
jgi:hypothetical protein